MTLISDFISKIQAIQKTGAATEHSYRSAFEGLFAGLGVTALNEPKRVKCGAPDFIISQGVVAQGPGPPERGSAVKRIMRGLVNRNNLALLRDWGAYSHRAIIPGIPPRPTESVETRPGLADSARSGRLGPALLARPRMAA